MHDIDVANKIQIHKNSKFSTQHKNTITSRAMEINSMVCTQTPITDQETSLCNEQKTQRNCFKTMAL